MWAKEKHAYLARYIQISSATRKMYLPDARKPNIYKGGATYIDLFCGAGKSKIKDTEEWIDGSAVVAWKASQKSGSPFSHIYISDLNEEYLRACETRLTALGATVTALHLNAVDAVTCLQRKLGKYALHFAFIDPFDIKSLDFRIIHTLASLNRLDMLIHLSKMDLQRNMVTNLRKTGAFSSDFDSFIPGWETVIDTNQGLIHIRDQVVRYWTDKLKQVGVTAAKDVNWKLITGTKKQPLYWLMLVARHELAHDFWEKTIKTETQETLFS